MAEAMRHIFTSESVTEGHPDKMADQISDAVLDAVLKEDPTGRVACEVLVTTGLIVVAGEITTNTYVDVPTLARSVTEDIGFTDSAMGFDAKTCGILNAIQSQSPDIAMGVDTGGAGDQGLMFGYACDETAELMPMPIMMAHKLVQRLSESRKSKQLPWLRPDGKSQVSVEYVGGKPKRIDAVVISTQHDPDVTTEELRAQVKKHIIDAIIPSNMVDSNTKYHINPTGRFVIGGPHGDTGLTGRKSLSIPTAAWAVMAAVPSLEKIPQRLTVRPATWRATWPRILWHPVWLLAWKCNLLMPSASPNRCRSW